MSGIDVMLCVPLRQALVDTRFFGSFVRAKDYFLSHTDLLPFKVNRILTRMDMSTFPIDANRNVLAAQALDEAVDYTIWFDTDQRFPEDVILKLLKHQKSIVSGMYFAKNLPYFPIIFNCVDKAKKQFRHFRPIMDYPQNGDLYYADMIGAGCMAVQTAVFDKIKQPFFKYQEHPPETFVKDWRFRVQNKIQDVTEDVWFCKQVRDAGFKIIVDPSIKCTHFSSFEVTEGLFRGVVDQVTEDYVKEHGQKKFDKMMENQCRPELVKSE